MVEEERDYERNQYHSMKHTEGFDDLIRYDLEMFDIKSRSTNQLVQH